jgi:hypothetical protein
MNDESDPLQSSLDAFHHRLDHLRSEGLRLRASLAASSADDLGLATLTVWQNACAATIGQLSGGSKAHWLARAFSDALLVPNAETGAASVVTIVSRVLDVLDRADASLEHVTSGDVLRTDNHPAPRARFTFVKDEALRSSLERAYLDGREAFSRGEFALALVTFCSILETIITDALVGRGPECLSAQHLPAWPVADWPFATRIEVAERARIVSAGCARLPGIARRYRELLDPSGEIVAGVSVSPRDAKLASDVLHVILRDLAPGR